MSKRKNKEEATVIKLEKENKGHGKEWSYWDGYHEVEEHLGFLKGIAEMFRTISGNCSLEEIAHEEGLWRIFKDVGIRLKKIEQFNEETFRYVKSLKESVEATSLEG